MHVALLRGVNVGGARPLPMAALRQVLEVAGFTRVQTYVQSGNVVVEGGEGCVEADLAARIRACIAAGFSLDVPVVVRSAAAMRRVANANPWLGMDGASNTQMHVAFLERRPAPEAVAALDPGRAPPDRLAVVDREVYAYCPQGLGRSKIFVGMERILGTPATVRNWNTVERLVTMSSFTARSS